MRAIEGSRIAIAVFSKNYAGSSWCLDELVKIIQCHKTNGLIVLPVFYNVDPSHVRHQKGEFGTAFKASAKKRRHLQHDERASGKRYRSAEVLDMLFCHEWLTALTEAANFSGWNLKNYRNEAELVKQIVKDVLTKLDSKLLSITEFPVGLDSRVQQIVKLIENHSKKVYIIGISGMGGAGKTTAAKAIYNQIHGRFKYKSFIEDIREVCQTERRGLVHLQKKLPSDVLQTRVEIDSIGMGTNMIENKLAGKKTLIVLDDVNEFDQLKALCGSCSLNGQGSLIIITTRDVHLLNIFGVDYFYEMLLMDEHESFELFSWHAFKQAQPREYYNELTKAVVAYCDGLPLALEVLGSYLCKRSRAEWYSVLSKLKVIPDARVQRILRISFDSLSDHMEKDIFLDLCCFFIGKNRACVTEILNRCQLHADIGITVLIERNLIKVDKNNKLRMHPLLRDMGREIICESSRTEPGKRSRLWFQKDVLDVLTSNTGTAAIEGLVLKLHAYHGNGFKVQAFKKMRRLRLLQLDHVELIGDYGLLSKQLRWVCWQGFPSKYISNKFYLEDVAAISLKHSNLRLLWKKPQVLEQLTILNLSHSKFLTETPDFSSLPSLEKLILKDCRSLCKGLATSESSDVFLPGDNYPYWLAYTGDGPSVSFSVPEDCHMKGMTFCVVYLPRPETMAAKCLISVLIVNYTKCTIHIHKLDTVTSFNDADWQGIISHIGFGDKLKIFVTFGQGLMVKKTSVYLMYGESIHLEMEQSPEPKENSFLLDS